MNNIKVAYIVTKNYAKEKKLDKNQTQNKRTKDRTSEKELGGFRVQLT
jgi:hypothetical protein